MWNSQADTDILQFIRCNCYSRFSHLSSEKRENNNSPLFFFFFFCEREIWTMELLELATVRNSMTQTATSFERDLRLFTTLGNNYEK